MTINSRTAFEQIIKDPEVCEIRTDIFNDAIGYGFFVEKYFKWMKGHGFRTDSAKCAARRWLKDWEEINWIYTVYTDKDGITPLYYYIAKPPHKYKQACGQAAYDNGVQSVYGDNGTLKMSLWKRPESMKVQE